MREVWKFGAEIPAGLRGVANPDVRRATVTDQYVFATWLILTYRNFKTERPLTWS